MLTEARLAEIAAADRAATPGPWKAQYLHRRLEVIYPFGVIARFADWCLADGFTPPPHPDAEFIALARTAVPDLLAEVQRLRAGLADLRMAHHPGHAQSNVGGSWAVGTCPKSNPEWRGIWGPAVCNCGADEHNARIDALLASATL